MADSPLISRQSLPRKKLSFIHMRAARTARVSFLTVTIACHDRYFARTAPPITRHASKARGIASTSCLT